MRYQVKFKQIEAARIVYSSLKNKYRAEDPESMKEIHLEGKSIILDDRRYLQDLDFVITKNNKGGRAARRYKITELD